MMDKLKYMMYVGTYTLHNSKGIYAFELDAETGQLQPVGEPVSILNPSYLAIGRDNRTLYSVMETEKYSGLPGGGVAAYSVNPKTGKLQFINQQPTKGKSPCHLSVDSQNRCLFAANYQEGTVTAFPIRPDGGIDNFSSIIMHQGSGLDPERQEKPHAHYVTLTPDEKYLCAVDLGIDQIVVYRYDKAAASLSTSAIYQVKIRPGSGPRHMEFSPDARFAYLANELSSDITVLRYHSEPLSFEAVQYISALPEGYAGVSYCAAIHVSPDGRFLYVSNRGHDSIAVFRIDPSSGRIEKIALVSVYGSWPRDFAIDPTGKYLFAANQYSGNIVPFAIDRETGILEKLDYEIDVPDPACIKFLTQTLKFCLYN